MILSRNPNLEGLVSLITPRNPTLSTAARAFAPITPCSQRREMGKMFAIAARQYAEAIVTLTLNGRTAQEFEGLCQTNREMRQRMENARLAFEDHVRAHGCY